MDTINMKQHKKLHPHKFLMWVAIGSICMMFAGLTSAYVVKKSQDNVISVNLPTIFLWSTVVILISSLTLQMAVKAIKAEQASTYKKLLLLTAALGVLFAVMQYKGFVYLDQSGVEFIGRNSNPGASFLLIIIGLHSIHVLGGVIALIVMSLKNNLSKISSSIVSTEVMAAYWHFVDVLWIYLLIFLIFMR
ncbi:MAG: cytochrome c oxidase subunit 3 [Chitinophagaceae bacterium]|nr:cytochrome c oxidase subunit 3 [Chitinophagaceae bacterium]